MVGFARWIALVSVPLAVFAANAAPITAFYYTSSPASYVGHGETVTVTPAEGFQFTANPNFDNGVSFAINDFLTNPDFQKTRWWYLDFAAPFSALLTVGFYDHATRFAFQHAENPGLDVRGNGRGNNMLTGFFEVLEAVYAADGSVLKFAADFTQFDEGLADWWNRGSIRFNSDTPLIISQAPEPSTGLLLFAALLAVATVGHRRRRERADDRPTRNTHRFPQEDRSSNLSAARGGFANRPFGLLLAALPT